jgi:hypothetical protein
MTYCTLDLVKRPNRGEYTFVCKSSKLAQMYFMVSLQRNFFSIERETIAKVMHLKVRCMG